MPRPQRTLEVRILVIATVDLADQTLAEALAQLEQPSSVAAVVAAEVASNLDSVSYVETAIVSQL